MTARLAFLTSAAFLLAASAAEAAPKRAVATKPSPGAPAASAPFPARAAARPASPNRAAVSMLRQLVELKDFLGARVQLRRLAALKLVASEWQAVRAILYSSPLIGNDLIFAWDHRRAGLPPALLQSAEEKLLADADKLSLSGKRVEAAAKYQELLAHLDKRSERANAAVLRDYVNHRLARAQFGSRDYPQALVSLGAISTGYSRYRQVMFERMWAAFRAGRVDTALGAIASQRAGYFSRYMEPESYLLQVYLYRMLCRKDDVKQAMDEIATFRSELDDGKFGAMEWAEWDIEHQIHRRLALTEKFPESPIPEEARRAERDKVRAIIAKRFALRKPRLVEDLARVEAYSQLAITPGLASGLKALEKLPSRAALFKSNLEIWPADDGEVWSDEIGKHRFVGESLCAKQ